MGKVKYAEDRPDNCAFCHFWVNDKIGCQLGKKNCYYLLESPRMVPMPCDGCPYCKGGPCIGWCTSRILGKKGVDIYAA
ncbi:MAG: hypothetical protein PHX08_05125 [Lachnospiraceae bacterium]|nr:hypothetical protein [Lachnospiraceae bacterium]